jgi:hypothetical protein
MATRIRLWWSPSQDLIRGGTRDTVPADAEELFTRSELHLATDLTERAARAVFRAMWGGAYDGPRTAAHQYAEEVARTLAAAGLLAAPAVVWLAGSSEMDDEVYAVYATEQDAVEAAGPSRHRIRIMSHEVVGAAPAAQPEDEE